RGSSVKTRRRIFQNWQLYAFLLIPTIYVFIFNYIPMAGVQIAFKKYNLNLGIWGSPWLGFDNFTRFFQNTYFERTLVNTLRISVYALVAGFPMPIILALFLNSMNNLRFKKLVQTITYVPHFISVVVIVGLLLQIFNPKIGLFAVIYKAVTVGGDVPDLFGKPDAFPHLYVWSGIWQSMGWGSIVYVAALSGVDASLHEAAEIDGASKPQRIWHIDFPSILPTAVMLLIMNAGRIMSVGFEKVLLMQNNLNLRTSEIISTYVYKVGLSSITGDYGYATAIGLFNSIINLALILAVNYISRKLTEQSLW
ncbi:MAG: ABC transporter permease subunit, partial [Clostridia bacterium]